ncbi:MAG: DUF4339 domain-containing protein [Candidatus Acidiferrales bacterium]
MNYTVKRGEERFGPYSLADLQKYFQEGRVLAGDFAQSEGMTEWVPVSQILGNIPMPALTPAGGASTVPAQELVPLPPNLHWAILLVILVIVRVLQSLLDLLLTWIWALILANWARKLSGDNKAMVLVAMYPAGFVAGILAIGFGTSSHEAAFSGLGIVFILAGAIAYILGIFKIRAAMEEYYNSRENIALTLSGVMTFFFSTIYLQYHVNRIARWKQTGILS